MLNLVVIVSNISRNQALYFLLLNITGDPNLSRCRDGISNYPPEEYLLVAVIIILAVEIIPAVEIQKIIFTKRYASCG